MKTKHRQSQLWIDITFIFILSLSLLLLPSGLCRPASPHGGRKNNSSNLSTPTPPDDPSGSEVRHASHYDLRHMGRSEIHGTRGRRMRNNDTLFLYSGVIGGSPGDDVPDVIAGRRHRVVPSADRNLVRRRREPEPDRPHRRRRRKHRRVLKARERNHLSEDNDSSDQIRPDPRGVGHPPLLKSDSPGYLITNASEIRKDWCRTLPLQELVSEPHCQPRVVRNHFCYGQCNSFFIPYTARTDKREFFQSCAFCKPLKQHWGNVTLNCPGRNPPKIVKTVLFVDKCRCITEILQ